MNEQQWPEVQEAIERADIASRIWLSTWFIDSLSRRPDELERLWRGSVDADIVGWRWCEYRITERRLFSGVFLALYDGCLSRLPTAPVFVLRATCRHCGRLGFFVSANVDKARRVVRGVPSGRCAECRRAAARARARQRT